MDISTQRIFELIEAHGINAARLQIACDLNNSSISKWKKGTQNPSADAIVRIADYFGVSTDYLLGRTDNPHPSDYIPKNNIPYRAVMLWEKLAPHEVSVVLNLLESLVSSHPQK